MSRARELASKGKAPLPKPKIKARTRARLPSVVLRNDALVVALAAQQGKTAGMT